MSSIIIISHNKKTVAFWNAKLSSVNRPILKVNTVNEAIKYAPSTIIVDDYFMNVEDHSWLNDQVVLLRRTGFDQTIICLSPRFMSIRSIHQHADDNIYYHHFNQSFIDAISKSVAA